MDLGGNEENNENSKQMMANNIPEIPNPLK
jgi:hypothetical protein